MYMGEELCHSNDGICVYSTCIRSVSILSVPIEYHHILNM